MHFKSSDAGIHDKEESSRDKVLQAPEHEQHKQQVMLLVEAAPTCVSDHFRGINMPPVPHTLLFINLWSSAKQIF